MALFTLHFPLEVCSQEYLFVTANAAFYGTEQYGTSKNVVCCCVVARVIWVLHNCDRIWENPPYGIFCEVEFDASISSTIELTRVQIPYRSCASLWRYSALFAKYYGPKALLCTHMAFLHTTRDPEINLIGPGQSHSK